MFNRSQVDSATTSDARETNCLPSYLLKIRGGREVDSKGNKAGKGPLIQTNVSATLGVSQDQYLFTPRRYTLNSTEIHGVIYDAKSI